MKLAKDFSGLLFASSASTRNAFGQWAFLRPRLTTRSSTSGTRTYGKPTGADAGGWIIAFGEHLLSRVSSNRKQNSYPNVTLRPQAYFNHPNQMYLAGARQPSPERLRARRHSEHAVSSILPAAHKIGSNAARAHSVKPCQIEFCS